MKLTALLIITLIVASSCARQDLKRTAVATDTNIHSAPTVSATPTPTPTVDYTADNFGEGITHADKIVYTTEVLKYQGYEVEKRVRKSKIVDEPTDVEYAALKRNGRDIVKFDDSDEPSTEVRFGLHNFLNEEHQQLIVEQTANKFWHYWVLRLSPKMEVVYDSGWYDLAFYLRSLDLDGDGRLEIVQNLASFWYRLGDNVSSPRPDMIFKYDDKARRYIPANSKFQSVVLKDIDRRVEKVHELAGSDPPALSGLRLQSAVGDIVIRYLYAGKQRTAWQFFEREIKDSDLKKSTRTILKKVLRDDALYKEIAEGAH